MRHIDIDPEIPRNAVSIYGNNDAMDDFPVLKAFQQYIDSEHAKARKRLISLGIFFGAFTGVIIAIFVILLMNVSARNQALNDRLIEFAMKDRDRGQAAVVVQPPIQQDNSALMAVTAKLESLQKQLLESRSEKVEVKAQKVQESPKGPSPAELEVLKLKALLSAEKEKLAEEKKRQKEFELEAYRRKYYTELYEEKPEPVRQPATRKTAPKRKLEPIEDIDDEDAEDISLDDGAISYFDDEEEETKKVKTPSRKYYSIPVEIRGSRSNWQVPND